MLFAERAVERTRVGAPLEDAFRGILGGVSVEQQRIRIGNRLRTS